MSEVKLPIFMDNHSTTRVDPRVLETILPYFDVPVTVLLREGNN